MGGERHGSSTGMAWYVWVSLNCQSVTFQFKSVEQAHCHLLPTITLESIQLSEFCLAAVWHNNHTSSPTAQAWRIRQRRLPLHLQFTPPRSERSIGIILLVNGTLCLANLVLTWLPVMHCRYELPYPLCPCEHSQTLDMSMFGTEPYVHKLLTSFHVFRSIYSPHVHNIWWQYTVNYIFKFLMGHHLVRAYQTVNVIPHCISCGPSWNYTHAVYFYLHFNTVLQHPVYNG
jgi:hypothetical protein